MTSSHRKRPQAMRWILLAGIAGTLLGSFGIASALSSSTTTTDPSASAPAPAADPQHTRAGETALTGDTADKVKAAALAAVPGATVDRLETDADGATYEAHLTKPDGSHVTVKEDGNFKVTSVDNGGHCAHGGARTSNSGGPAT